MEFARLLRPSDSKIVLVVLDGLGGFADAEHGSELEEATTPHLDQLATEGILGLLDPVGAGITPGSGPGHLALFGYDPLEFRVGRGAMTAAGIGVELGPGDVAARGNLCTLDHDGTVLDRRAGRVGDVPARAVVEQLASMTVEQGQVEIHHVAEYRVLLVLRGDFDADVTDTDPQRTGVRPHQPTARSSRAERTAKALSSVLEQTRRILTEPPVNGLLLRGFEAQQRFPAFAERTGLRAAAIAAKPLYRGVANLIGMDVCRPPASLDDACQVLEACWSDHDFFFFHVKKTDEAGEDGNRAAKQQAIEDFDAIVPLIRNLGPNVIAVSGDHATPSQLAAHSWHPVPTLIHNGTERDEYTHFGERWCRLGALGRRPSTELMPMLLAMSGRLDKFGA